MIPRRIPIERIDRTAGTMKSRMLPGSVFKGLYLALFINTTEAGTSTQTVREVCQMIDKLEITLDGSDTQVSIPMDFLLDLNTYEFGVSPDSTLVTTGPAQDQIVHLYLPFALLRAVVPKDTLLDTRKLSSAVINVHWNSGNTMTGVDTVNSGYLLINGAEYTNVARDVIFGRHEFSYSNGGLNKTGKIEFDLEVRGNNQYRRLWVYTYDSAGALSNDEIDNLLVRDRTFTHFDATEKEVQAMNKVNFNLSSVTTGLYVIDFPTDGMMTERINAMALDELVLEINSEVTDGTFRIVKEKVIA